MKSITTNLIVMALCLLVTGCGQAAEPPVEIQLCDDLVELQAALQPLINVKPGTSTSDVRRNSARLANAWRSLTLAGRNLYGIRINEWRSVYNQLIRSIERLPNNPILGEAATDIAEDARDLNRLAEEAFSNLNCR